MRGMSRFTQPTILMCPPDFYGIEYEINPWMSRSQGSDSSRAKEQWQSLKSLIESLGARVELLSPVPGHPDLVFTANAGLIWRDVAIVSRFRFDARRGESPIDAAWFKANGFEVRELPGGMDFEGAGDGLFCGETLFAGYTIRSDARAEQWVADQIGCRVIPLQLVDPHYYHLDTCFCPLNTTTAAWFPAAFDDYAQKVVREHIPALLEVIPEEASRFACNAVVIGTDVILNSGCPQFERRLTDAGFVTHATELDEFIKAGGSAKCLTLRLDGEDAAIWPPPDTSA
jgi:N-dimethylarginine dimethylaminohydrolase